MKVVTAYPPNYLTIVKHMPQARRVGVIFAYGDTLYKPYRVGEMTPHLMAHEKVHGERQQVIGVNLWWNRYLTNRAFRYNEELLAHRAEYSSMVAHGYDAKVAALQVAHRLASSLYGCQGGVKQALIDLMEIAEQ